MVKHTRVVIPAALAIVLLWASAAAAQVYVYPQKGQSPDQQARDQSACQAWAVQQTGFNPAAPPAAAPPPPPPSGGSSALRGGARGAAVGAVGGAIAGDAGKGAAVGAATGALIGGVRKRDQQQQYQQQVQAQQSQQAAMAAQGSDAYNRAYAACMTGRGYTVR